MDATATITRLFVYPVKSCAAVTLDHATLTKTGLEFDRAWMVVDAHGQFVTQRELPRMALIQPQLKTFEMVLRAPGMLDLYVQLDKVEQPVQATVWQDTVPAFDMGDLAAQWFSDFLGRPLRLVRFDPDHRRLSSAQWTGDAKGLNQFSDGYAVLVISEASLAGLNQRLAAPTSCWQVSTPTTKTAWTNCTSPPTKAKHVSVWSNPARAVRFPILIP